MEQVVPGTHLLSVFHLCTTYENVVLWTVKFLPPRIITIAVIRGGVQEGGKKAMLRVLSFSCGHINITGDRLGVGFPPSMLQHL